MPSRCFWLQVCFAQLALGKLDVLLALHVTDSGDDGAFFGILFGVEALFCQLIPVA